MMPRLEFVPLWLVWRHYCVLSALMHGTARLGQSWCHKGILSRKELKTTSGPGCVFNISYNGDLTWLWLQSCLCLLLMFCFRYIMVCILDRSVKPHEVSHTTTNSIHTYTNPPKIPDSCHMKSRCQTHTHNADVGYVLPPHHPVHIQLAESKDDADLTYCILCA